MILRMTELCEKLGVSRTSIWRWCRAGTFPQPVKLGRRAVGWRQTEVEEWLQALEQKTA